MGAAVASKPKRRAKPKKQRGGFNDPPAEADRDPVRVALGERMREARLRAGKRLVDGAAAIGRTLTYYRWHEIGVRSMRADEIVACARAFGCQPAFLMPTLDNVDPINP